MQASFADTVPTPRGRAGKVLSSCILLLAFVALSRPLAAQTAAADQALAAAKSVDYAIVVTGTELLAGGYADAHAPFLTRTLHPRGLRCVLIMIVDDRLKAIQEAVRLASEHAPLVIVTGGLGPTEDDVTRQAISAATGISLAEHPTLLDAMARRFNTPIDQLRENLRRQTQVPEGGSYLENPGGTAAGLIFETGQKVIVALPGPPRELQPMVHERLLPFLAKRFGIGAVGGLLRVRFVGIGESSISDAIDQHVPIPKDVIVGSLFEGMRVDFYFSLPGSAPEDLARLDVLKDQIIAQLGDFVYATGATTLESHVVELFANRQETLALAEVGSGGSVAASLGSSDAAVSVLAGAYVAPSEDQLCRLLGRTGEPATPGTTSRDHIAARLAEQTGAGWAVYVGPMREDNAAGRCVDLVIRHPDGHTESRPLTWRGTGDLGRFNLTTQVLDVLRRNLRP